MMHDAYKRTDTQKKQPFSEGGSREQAANRICFRVTTNFYDGGHRDDGESGAGLPVGLGLSESMAGKKVNTMGTGGDETRFSGSYFFI